MDQDSIQEYLEQNPDITSGTTLDKQGLIGESIGGILSATKKVSKTLGSFKDKFQSITSTKIVTTLKSIAGRILFNGEGVYDPSKNAVIVGGLKLQGVTDCVIKVPDTFDSMVGLDGAVVPFSKAGITKMTLTILKTSPSHQGLAHAYNTMTRERKGLLEVIVQENGDTVFIGKAVISKMPDIKLDLEASDSVYELTFI